MHLPPIERPSLINLMECKKTIMREDEHRFQHPTPLQFGAPKKSRMFTNQGSLQRTTNSLGMIFHNLRYYHYHEVMGHL